MIREWIKRVAMAAYDEHYAAQNQPVEGTRNQSITGSPLVTVHKLSNGYLIASSNNTPYLSDGQVLVFCEDIGKIGDHIIAMEARVRMGVPPNVSPSNPVQQRDLFTAAQKSYTP